MTRWLTLRAEVLGGLDDPMTKVSFPNAVHRDAADQRIRGINNPTRKSKPVARRVLWQRIQHRGHFRLDLSAFVQMTATNQNVRGPVRLHRFHDKRFGYVLGLLFLQFGNLLANLVELRMNRTIVFREFHFLTFGPLLWLC